MNRYALAFLALILTSTAHAQSYGTDVDSVSSAATPSPTPSPENHKALLNDLSQYIVSIDHPIYIYNWFTASGRSSTWTSKLSAKDPAGLYHLQNGAKNYFQAFCTNTPQDPADCGSDDVRNMFGKSGYYGPGLYGATDPIATRDFAGTNDWVLMQIRLPKGFRMLTTTWTAAQTALSQGAYDELNALGCQDINNNFISTALDSMLKMGVSNLGKDGTPDQQRCTLAVRKILKDELKMEGLFYSYVGAQLSECNSEFVMGTAGTSPTSASKLRNSAFVIANPQRIQATDVKVFNSQTRDGMLDRVRISSLFYHAAHMDTLETMNGSGSDHSATIAYYNTNGVPGLPGYTVNQFYDNTCMSYGTYSNVCGNWYYVVNSSAGVGTFVPLDDPPAPKPADGTKPSRPKMSAAHVPDQMQGFLWADLDGKDQEPKMGAWVKSNLLGCQDIAPYSAKPEDSGN